jgi:hypothetical protein
VQFGPSGHRTKPSGLVTENYLHRLPQRRRKHVKSIVDPARVVGCTDAHYFIYDHGYAVDENHYPLSLDATPYASTSRLQLNHYGGKSEEEFRAKLDTPDPLRGGSRPPLDFEQLLKEERHCGRVDTAIQQYLPALREALRQAPRAGGP